MVKIAGNFQHVKSENIAAHFLGLGAPEELAKKIAGSSPTLDVVVESKNKIIITLKYAPSLPASVFTVLLDQEFDEHIQEFNTNLKSAAKLDGNVLTVTSTLEDGRILIRKYEFSDNELVVTNKVEGATFPDSKRFYKRV